MKINIGIFLAFSFISIFSNAQTYPMPPGKIYSGTSSNNQICRLQLNTVSNGWSVEIENKITRSKILFHSHSKIEVQNSAWVSRDLMSRVSKNLFESLTSITTQKQVFNILMTCQLNALNEPIKFTLEVQDTSPSNSYLRAVNCQIN